VTFEASDCVIRQLSLSLNLFHFFSQMKKRKCKEGKVVCNDEFSSFLFKRLVYGEREIDRHASHNMQTRQLTGADDDVSLSSSRRRQEVMMRMSKVHTRNKSTERWRKEEEEEMLFSQRDDDDDFLLFRYLYP